MLERSVRRRGPDLPRRSRFTAYSKTSTSGSAALLVIRGRRDAALIKLRDGGVAMPAPSWSLGAGAPAAPTFLSVFDKPPRDALVMLFLRLHHQQIVAAEILWGLWLFPWRPGVQSRFLPRVHCVC